MRGGCSTTGAARGARGGGRRPRSSERACAGRAGSSRTRWRACYVRPWPGEVLEDRAGEIAVGFAALLTRQSAWRHRRVETITVLSHEQARRAVSVGFTVPLEHRDDVRLADGQWIVPLALLEKRPLVHFDLFDEDLAAIPLLRSDEARSVVRELLYVVLDLDLDGNDPEFDADRLIERVLAAGPDDDVVAQKSAALAPRLPEF